jgi:hypothetical protein
MSESDNYIGIMLEEIRDQNRAVLEAVGQMQDDIKHLPTRDEFTALADDVKTIKAAVKATNADLADLDGRVARLESAA